MNPETIVIGGGFAGLRAAITLSDAGLRVLVLEAKSGLGGRARSFTDPASGEVVDNGQHLFLSGYKETLRFLDRLGTRKHLIFQDRLQVAFIEPGGKRHLLDCPPHPSPWHLLAGMMRLSSLSWMDKFSLPSISRAVAAAGNDAGNLEGLDRLTAEEWLKAHRQSSRGRKGFWDPLVVATLNEDPAKVSALGLVSVLNTLMCGPSGDARLGISSVGLSDLYGEATREIIEGPGGEVRLNQPVARLLIEDSNAIGVTLADGSEIHSQAVVSTVSPGSLLKIVPPEAVANDPALKNLDQFTTSPIVSINLWLDRPLTQDFFIGMIGTRVQWLFNKPMIFKQAGLKANYIALLISAAHAFIDQPNDSLISMALEDLRACFPNAKKAKLIRFQVVRERDATVSLGVGTDRLRVGPETGIGNLFLAGDWTKTGLPATIESAVASGENCARSLLKKLASAGVERYNNPIIHHDSSSLSDKAPNLGEQSPGCLFAPLQGIPGLDSSSDALQRVGRGQKDPPHPHLGFLRGSGGAHPGCPAHGLRLGDDPRLLSGPR